MSVLLDYLNGILKLHYPVYAEEDTPAGRYYKWVLKNGKLFTEREEVKKFHPTFEKMSKGCYYNAQFMAMEYERLKYYEGWGVTEKVGIPLDHAFNIVNDKVVDISWVDGIEYFGIEVPVKFAMSEMLKEKTAHPILFNWWEETERRKRC